MRSTTLILASAASVSALTYKLTEEYTPANFFDESKFTFVTYSGSNNDGTGGFADYKDKTYALNTANGPLASSSRSSVKFGADSQNVVSESSKGRPSVRLEAVKSFSKGIVVADIKHMPGNACGAWPAFWSFGSDWPNDGEIDILEGVNFFDQNKASLHTGSDTCTINDMGDLDTGVISSNGNSPTTNCATTNSAGQIVNGVGCSIDARTQNNYGDGFNSVDGGYYITQWTDDFIKIWFYPRANKPATLNSDVPDPSTLGTPMAYFSGCQFGNRIKNQRIVFTTNFCGAFAGAVGVYDQTYANNKCPNYNLGNPVSPDLSCRRNVALQPAQYANQYWEVNGVKIFTESTTSSTSSTVSSTSSRAASSSPSSRAASSSPSSRASSSPSVVSSRASSVPSASNSGSPSSSAPAGNSRSASSSAPAGNGIRTSSAPASSLFPSTRPFGNSSAPASSRGAGGNPTSRTPAGPTSSGSPDGNGSNGGNGGKGGESDGGYGGVYISSKSYGAVSSSKPYGAAVTSKPYAPVSSKSPNYIHNDYDDCPLDTGAHPEMKLPSGCTPVKVPFTTKYTTTIVDICETGFTTKTVTTSVPYCAMCHEHPTSPYNGFTEVVKTCSKGCAPSPIPVTVTVQYEAKATPEVSYSKAYDAGAKPSAPAAKPVYGGSKSYAVAPVATGGYTPAPYSGATASSKVSTTSTYKPVMATTNGASTTFASAFVMFAAAFAAILMM